VLIDGHAIVTRHLAILAMTGSGKSWTARRIIEQLAAKKWPMVIFDPRGDYARLGEIPSLQGRVRRYYAQFPVFEQEPDTLIKVIQSLGWNLANTHLSLFDDLLKGAKSFISAPSNEHQARVSWLRTYLMDDGVLRSGLRPDFYSFAYYVEALVKAGKLEDENGLDQILEWSGDHGQLRLSKGTARNLEGFPRNLRRAAKRLREMENISKKAANASEPLPLDRKQLVDYGRISVIALSGYQGDFQATIYSLVADDIFSARLSNDLKYPVLLVLEEAHNFAPGRTNTVAEEQAVATTRQIAQEGRKFGVGLILISQRPSRLDETALSQCNSYIVMRMSNPADQNYVRRVIETLGEDEAKMLPDLDVGEAILSGQLINFPVLVRIKPPESKGEREEEDAFEALEEAHSGTTSGAR
jgi:DNA helicase HerA-like ATPase